MGIEPTRPAWKAGALPLSYTRFKIIGERRIRTSEGVANRFTVCPLWPLGYLPAISKLTVGLEPTTC